MEVYDIEQPEAVVESDKGNPYPHATADHYLWELHRLEDSMRAGEIKPLDAQREMDVWHKFAASYGIDLKEAAEDNLDPIRKLLTATDLIDHNEKTLNQIKNAMAEADVVGAKELTVKKKWIQLIDLTLALQMKAKSNPVHFSIYVLRCQETNNVLKMETIHVNFFKIWNDPVNRNTEILAPPGVGKTTCLYGQDLWGMVHDTKLRFLKMCGKLSQGQDRIDVVRLYLMTRRLRALYPHVKVDTRQVKKNNASQFTLERENISQDPSMFAAGSMTDIQGVGLEELDFDDLCGLRVANEPSTRKKIHTNFRAVAFQRRRNLMKSRIRYIATPWHMDDATMRLMHDIRDGKLIGWTVHLFPVKEDAHGNPIPPTSKPGWAAELKTIKDSDPFTYSCCYKLNPHDRQLRRLKGFVYYDVSGGTSPLCPEDNRDYHKRLLTAINNGERWQALDPAAGGKDSTGMVGFSISPRGTAAITSASFFRSISTETIEMVCNKIIGKTVDKVLIESGANKGQVDHWTAYLIARLGDDYSDRIETAGTQLRNEKGQYAGQNVSKGRRYYNAIPYLENGVVMFPGKWTLNQYRKPVLGCCDDEGLEELHTQLLNYPAVVHDDGIDCVSMFINFHVGTLVRAVQALRKPVMEARDRKPMGVLAEIYRERQEARKKQSLEPKGVRVEDARMFAA